MKLIDRYVGRQVLTSSAFAVAVLSVVLVLGNIFKKLLDLLVNHDVPVDLILSLVGYILPFSLTFTIPWGFLTAVLLVFGKMSAENELIAFKSNGISIPRVTASVFGLALVFVGICMWINVEVAPRAQKKMQDAFYNIATSNPLALFSSDKVIEEFPFRKIYVGRNEGRELFNLLVCEFNEDLQPIRVLHAQRGALETDLANKQVLMRLYDAQYEQRDEVDPEDLTKINQATMQETVFPIPLTELYEKNKKKRGPSAMTIEELLRGRSGVTDTAARTELSKRFSTALASLAFALFAVPLAITAHRRETSIGFMLSLGVAFLYFFLVILIDTVRDKPEWRPELLIWGPNLLFMAIGAWLFYRLSKR
ncbi:MAG TPA: LptF/LptG family permease [Chthoniobacteraceae bacterium]|nr:LptF/LptG family permease [Chthoniobacteraceae bacterium]